MTSVAFLDLTAWPAGCLPPAVASQFPRRLPGAITAG